MPASLNVAELRKSIENSVADLKDLGRIDPGPGIFTDPGIIGFIIHTPGLKTLEVDPVNKVADVVAADFGKPVAVLNGKDILIGFIPTRVLKF